MRNSSAALVTVDPPPLTPEEEGRLAEYLAAATIYDIHGAVGLMHAVASAPARLRFGDWNPIDDADGCRLLAAAFRTIELELGRRRPFPPPPRDVVACRSFARGYLDGLEHWPASVPRLDRLRCAAWACALGERLDLLPPSDRAQFRLTGDGRAALRREIGRFMLLTYDLYALDWPRLALLDS